MLSSLDGAILPKWACSWALGGKDDATETRNGGTQYSSLTSDKSCRDNSSGTSYRTPTAGKGDQVLEAPNSTGGQHPHSLPL